MLNLYPKISFSLLISLVLFSCNIVNPNAPYTADQNTSSRKKITDVITANNISNYALILSPTSDQMSLFDLTDNRIKLSINTGRNPIALSVSPDKAHILVVNQIDNTLSSYYKQDNQSIVNLGFIGTGNEPSDVIFNNSGTEAYVVSQTSGIITVLSILNRARPKAKQVVSIKDDSSNISPSPFKLAISADNNTLYTIDKNSGKLYILKNNNGKWTQQSSISLGDNSQKTSLQDIITFNGKLYISDSNNSKVIVFDTKTNSVTNSIVLTNNEVKDQTLPTKMAINNQNKRLYVINQGTSSVGVIDLNNNTLIKHILLSNNTNTDSELPSDISISANGQMIYVTNSAGRNLSIISGKDDKLIRNIGTTPSSGNLLPLSAIQIL